VYYEGMAFPNLRHRTHRPICPEVSGVLVCFYHNTSPTTVMTSSPQKRELSFFHTGERRHLWVWDGIVRGRFRAMRAQAGTSSIRGTTLALL
jgi:hypothetical protein